MTTAEMTRELARMQRKVKAANVLDSSAARTALAAIARARYALKARNFSDAARADTYAVTMTTCEYALRAMAAEVTYYTLTAA